MSPTLKQDTPVPTLLPTSSRRTIKRYLNACIVCHRLRETPESRIMAPLPIDRAQETAPFDTTGLFLAIGSSEKVLQQDDIHHSEKWVQFYILFTWLESRAAHIEVLSSEDTTSFSFICASWWFNSIRSPCKVIRSDQGSNSISAKNCISTSSRSRMTFYK